MSNARIAGKILRCVELARDCRRTAWQLPNSPQANEYRLISKDAMQDARRWKGLGDL